ncbi:MAG: GAF domain-containing protein [Alphaproteobacteria bacterium]|nr:GAF domain-containing protein [Alphaproteobacteria bacterium]
MPISRNKRSDRTATAKPRRRRPAPPASHAGQSDILARRLRSLGEVASAINADTQLDAVLDNVVRAVCRYTESSMSAIMAVDVEARQSVVIARYDPFAKEPRSWRWSIDTSPVPRVTRERRPLVIRDVDRSQEFGIYREDAQVRGYKTLVLLPLDARDAQGRDMVLSVKSKTRRIVDAEELAFLETIMHLAAIAVAKALRISREEEDSARLRRVLGIHAELMGVALTDRSLAHVLQSADRALPFPLIVVDLITHTITAGRPPLPTIGVKQWTSALASQGWRLLSAAVLATASSGDHKTQRIAFDQAGIDLRMNPRIEPLVLEGETVGGLIILTGDAALTDFESLVAGEVRLAVSMQLMRNFIRFRSEAVSASQLVRELVEGAWRNREDLVANARRLGLNLDQPAHVLVFEVGVTPDQGRSVLHVSAAIREGSRPFKVEPLVSVSGQRFTAIVQAQPDVSKQRWADALKRVVDMVRWAAGRDPVAAVSGACATLGDYAEAARAGDRIVRLGVAFGRSGLLREQDFGHHALLLSAADQEAVRRFIADHLGPIEAHAKRHGSELIKTLTSFLRGGCRHQACVDELGIHVTTLKYRMERIAKLFGIDLDDPDERFSIELALRFRAYQSQD